MGLTVMPLYVGAVDIVAAEQMGRELQAGRMFTISAEPATPKAMVSGYK